MSQETTTGYGSTTNDQKAVPAANSGGLDNTSRSVRFVRWYIGVLFYLRYPLLLTWGLLLFLCALAGANLTQNLKDELAPPANSPAKIADEAFAEYFPSSINTTQFMIYFDSTPYEPYNLGLSPEMWALDAFMEYWMATFKLNFTTSTDPNVLAANMSERLGETELMAYSSFRVLETQNFWKPGIDDYLGKANYSIVAICVMKYLPSDPRVATFYDSFKKVVPDLMALANMTGKIDVAMMGLPAFLDEINSSSGRDIVVMFGVVVPIALIIFCATLDSLRLGILALCSLITTMLATLAVLDGAARYTDINAVTPGIVGAMCIALSSDFTYMLASKFRREVVLESAHFFDDPSGFTRGVVFVDPKHVMVMVMAYAGRVVFVTGTSVAFASLGLAFFPLTTFSSIGIGCIVSALMAMFVSLVLTPTLLITFYRFFATGAETCEWPTFASAASSASSSSSSASGGGGDSGNYQAVGSSGGGTSSATGFHDSTTSNPMGSQNEKPNHHLAISSGGLEKNASSSSSSSVDQQAEGEKKEANTPEKEGGGKKKKNENNKAQDQELEKNQKQQQNSGPQASAPSFTGSNFSVEKPNAASFAAAAGGGGGGVTSSASGSNLHAGLAGAGGNPKTNPKQRDYREHVKNQLPQNLHLSRDAVSRAQLQLRDKRVFYRDFTAFLSQPWIAFFSIVIVLALCLYPMTRATDGKFSNDMEQFVPRDSPLLPAWRSLGRQFGLQGDLFPYHVVVVFNKTAQLNKATAMGQPTVFLFGQMLIQQILQVPNTDPRGIESFFYDQHAVGTPQENVTWISNLICLGQAAAWIKDHTATFTPECKYRAAIWNIHATNLPDEPVTDITIRSKLHPTSAEGKQWVRDMRAKLNEMDAFYPNTTFYLSGYGSDSLALTEYAQDQLLKVVAIIISCAWFIVTIFFFSLGASLRLLVSLVFTLFTCFGLATIIFVDGALSSWPVPAGLAGAERAEAWLVPFAAIALNIATVLNYDISATIRVQQFRHMGIATRSAIVIAAIEGSNEVFIAAVMTIVSFSGLLFSQVAVMNQLGFFFICGAFLQGIVFRIFLVVPIMALLGEFNWFPYMQIAQKYGSSADGSSSSDGGEYRSGSSQLLDGGRKTTGEQSSAPTLLAPPAATQLLEDNEAVMWAVRESGLDPRSFVSNTSQRGSFAANNTLASASVLEGNSNSRSGSRRPSNFRNNSSFSSNLARPPVEFVFTPGSGGAGGGGAGIMQQQGTQVFNNNNNYNSATSAAVPIPNNNSITSNRGSKARSSVIVDEDQQGSSANSLKNFADERK